MLENFIYAKQKSLFEEKLNNGEVLDEAIVFIEDTKEIWNHGTYFATGRSVEEIENIVASSETVQAVIEQIAVDVINNSGKQDIIEDLDTIRSGAGLGATALQPGNGDGTKFLADDGTYKEINLDSKPAYHNICLDNYSDNIMSSDDFNELSLAIENQVPIIILLTGGNFIGSSACDATMDPGGNITLFYTIMSIEKGDLRYFRTLILSNDLSITIEELFNSSKINLAIQPEDLATTTTPGLMSAEDKAKLDQVTAVNTSIVTQAEYDALVSAGAATSGTVYYIRG